MYEMLLVGWVTSRISLGAQMRVNTAVASFLDFYKIPPEWWDVDTAAQFFYKAVGINETANFNNITKTEKEWQQITT